MKGAAWNIPAEFSEASFPGSLQRGLFCVLERVFSCSFSNATFSSVASRAFDHTRHGEAVVIAVNIPLTTLNVHLCEAGHAYLDAKHT